VTLTQGSNLTVLLGSGRANAGALTVGGDDPAAFPAAEVLLIAPPEGNGGAAWINAAAGKGANLVIIRETDFLKSRATTRPPRATTRLTESTPRQSQIDAVLVSAADYDRLAAPPERPPPSTRARSRTSRG
jgi:hypothetical protein